jgi:hypothetical protein
VDYLKRLLGEGIGIEIEITLQVATLLAADFRAFEIRKTLGITTQEYDVALARLRRAAGIMNANSDD